MKTKTWFIILLMIVFTLPAMARGGRWVLLGDRLVNDRLDHDIIPVTATRGDFNAILIRVRGASVDFHKVVIVYGNGNRQEVEMRNTIPAGGSTRVIDLQGTEIIIREVECWYDANTIRGRKALVRVFGRK
jgi:hypothetical protein